MKALYRAALSTAATLPKQRNNEWLGSAYDTPPIANRHL